jgi:hypothetical protein
MAKISALLLAAFLLAVPPVWSQSPFVEQQQAPQQSQWALNGQAQYYAQPQQQQPVYMMQAPQAAQQYQAQQQQVVLIPVGRLPNGQIAYVIQQHQQPPVQYVPVYIMPQTAAPAAPAAAAQPAATPAADPNAQAAQPSKHPIAKGLINSIVNVGGVLPGCSTGITATQPLLNLLLEKM